MLHAMSDELRELIERAGGLYTKADLAEHWGITRQRVQQYSNIPGFPLPVFEQGRAKWYAFHEVDAWYAHYKENPRKPGPKPPTKDTMT